MTVAGTAASAGGGQTGESAADDENPGSWHEQSFPEIV